MTQPKMPTRRDHEPATLDDSWWLGTTTTTTSGRSRADADARAALQSLRTEQLQELVHDQLLGSARPYSRLLDPAASETTADTATDVEHEQLLMLRRPAGRREGLGGLILGLVLVGLPVAGAIALGAWQAPDKEATPPPAQGAAEVAVDGQADVPAGAPPQSPPPPATSGPQVAPTWQPPVASSTTS